MPDKIITPTPGSRVIVLGNPPPTGLRGSEWRLIGQPLFDVREGDWDVMRETLWVHSLAATVLTVGTDRSRSSGIAGSVFRVVDYRVIGYKAGRPVVELVSKGWLRTKVEKWLYRRSSQGDLQKALKGGYTYSTRIYFTSTLLWGTYNANAVPPNGRWGHTSRVSYMTFNNVWPYEALGASDGWSQVGRESDFLTGTDISKVTDTYACINWPDGQAATGN